MITTPRRTGKELRTLFLSLAAVLLLGACSTNPATGESQFTALMSPQQEVQVGTQEHQKVMAQFGEYPDPALQAYIRTVGEAVTRKTERPDVHYSFYLLDTPVVNAFALPGGYIYITRGLMALANSEAEMAAVLAHETGHITARHSAERYSRGVVTSLGASILASAVGSSGVSSALGVGSDLYMKSYSRGQESQADDLGIRYLSRAGYDPAAMTAFLSSLQADTALEARIAGKNASSSTDYFATHPATVERVEKTVETARQYIAGGTMNRDAYLRKLDGLVYGDSVAQGFARGRDFYHPGMGFSFSVPAGFRIVNQPSQVIAVAQNGGAIIFDMAENKGNLSPMAYLHDVWMQGETPLTPEEISINGMQAATAAFDGSVNGKSMTIRLVAVMWSPGRVARFQIAIPRGVGAPLVEDLKRTTYSLRRLSEQEKRSIRPYRLKIVTAQTGDTVAALAQRMPFEDLREARFRVLNGLKANEEVAPGSLYKIVAE